MNNINLMGRTVDEMKPTLWGLTIGSTEVSDGSRADQVLLNLSRTDHCLSWYFFLLKNELALNHQSFIEKSRSIRLEKTRKCCLRKRIHFYLQLY